MSLAGGRQSSTTRLAPRCSMSWLSAVANRQLRSCAWAASRRSNGSRVHEIPSAWSNSARLGGSSTNHRGSSASETLGRSRALPHSTKNRISSRETGETNARPAHFRNVPLLECADAHQIRALVSSRIIAYFVGQAEGLCAVWGPDPTLCASPSRSTFPIAPGDPPTRRRIGWSKTTAFSERPLDARRTSARDARSSLQYRLLHCPRLRRSAAAPVPPSTSSFVHCTRPIPLFLTTLQKR